MAIATNDLIDVFGTQDAVTTTGASTADAAFTSAGQWTNDDDAPFIAAVLTAQWATATSIAGKLINLYGRPHNIISTNDASAPSTTNDIIYLGSFKAPASTATTDFYMPLIAGRASLPNMYTSQVWEFYIENKTGQTISVNWSLHVTPISYGPHP